MPKQKSKLDIKVAIYLDMLIGIYFSQKQFMENETLGEYIVSSKAIMPDYFETWVKEPIKL